MRKTDLDVEENIPPGIILIERLGMMG